MHEHATRCDHKAASRLAPKCVDGRFDIYVAMYGRHDWLYLERLGRRFKRGHINGYGTRSGIKHDCHPLETRSDLRQQLKPLACERRFQNSEASGIAAWAVERRHEA